MGSYNSQYENYYNSISNRTNVSRGLKLGQRQKKYFNRAKIIQTIKVQLLGTLVLFIVVFTCKTFVNPQTKIIYAFCKNSIDKNYNVNSIVNYSNSINVSNIEKYIKAENFNDIENKVENFIDSERAKFTGGKTIQQQINQEFAAPVSNKVAIFNDSKGSGKKILHNGIEFYIPLNTNINTVYNGVVEEAGENKEDGKYIIIDHGSGIETKYAHLNIIEVKKGIKVNKNQTIAKSGNTGEDKSYNLYFELTYMGEKLNPLDYIKI
ncbi:M23 family metallopeptidase [Clostridium akagii]|uniref:M23 family metallopeptidase n=1 Tax=Clostridium akagii TaxID=91623 RepID=UPI00047A0F3D|nr:M23 family metallopeptidase [Clostridium akagii]